MDYNIIAQLIGSLGFPIVACCAMFKMYNDQSKTLAELTQAINSLKDVVEHKE